MNTHEFEAALAAADPVAQERLDGVDLEAMEADLLADVEDERSVPSPAEVDAPRRRRRVVAAVGAAIGAAIVAAAVILVGGPTEHPTRAYSAELVRFAESSPLLLLDREGWRVQDANEERRREGIEGSMEFVTGKPIPYESIFAHEDGTESGMFPPSVRQRRVNLTWRRGSLEEALWFARRAPHPHGSRWIELPVLGTTAQVDARAEYFRNQGGPGNRQMTALWSEDGLVLELRAAVPDQAAFEDRLDWLAAVDLETWLEAMPDEVVKAADHDAVVDEMLRGIPVPRSFDVSRIPDEGLTSNRYQVGADVAATVSCLWMLQWGEARRAGDAQAEVEAERAMATARRWPIVREMAADGGYSGLLWDLAAAMRKGYWDWHGHRRRLLPHAEGLGCARLGIPLLPRKQKLQRERGLPLPR